MSIVVNGQRIDWRGYEFGVRIPGFHDTPCASYEEAADLAAVAKGASVLMRALYCTSWEEAFNETPDNRH